VFFRDFFISAFFRLVFFQNFWFRYFFVRDFCAWDYFVRGSVIAPRFVNRINDEVKTNYLWRGRRCCRCCERLKDIIIRLHFVRRRFLKFQKTKYLCKVDKSDQKVHIVNLRFLVVLIRFSMLKKCNYVDMNNPSNPNVKFKLRLSLDFNFTYDPSLATSFFLIDSK
jgi:hypothetical protein